MNTLRIAIGLAVALIAPHTGAAGAADSSQHQHHHHAGHEHHAEPRGVDRARHTAHPESGPTESERRHVPPAPPASVMHDMSNREMIEMMAMDDSASFGMVLLDQLEWRGADGSSALAWDGQAWFGNDYDKLWFKTEGERVAGEVDGRVELLWDRVIGRWWNFQTGIRHDLGEGPSRSWLGVGVQGLAPYWFDVEAALYVGEEGRTAARFSAHYDWLLTQRLILQPKFELEAFGKDDPRNGIGSGISNTQLGLRLRYEIKRELAPYAGVTWQRAYGSTADLARATGNDRSDVQLVIGVRAWF